VRCCTFLAGDKLEAPLALDIEPESDFGRGFDFDSVDGADYDPGFRHGDAYGSELGFVFDGSRADSRLYHGSGSGFGSEAEGNLAITAKRYLHGHFDQAD